MQKLVRVMAGEMTRAAEDETQCGMNVVYGRMRETIVPLKSTTFWFSSPKKTRKPFPPISGTVPDSTNNLCHPSRAFEPSFNHLQPTHLRSTNLEPEPDSATQARA
ncbi:hypothetical protein CROQUDRAFT_106197 [Cronartium quercuum f. sp. fusiforme G11]|uniref:Uncharacterized protein n=1 Tax=Cronartium quercuum f. sp. fusiforme G11 TaxID=708437 RepID=A0A9P6TDM9_9BASI|nr:hypothetical protein CROQUDRAFT_106197 [Cronartium quercuum f. sp. fusiforme G11]